MREGVIVQSVARALDILFFFQKAEALGITEIAERMELNKSTVFGLVNTLTVFGFLEQVAETKKYRLGLKCFELGNLVQLRMDIRVEARPFCKLLASKYATTVHLAVHTLGELVYVDKVDDANSVVVYSQVGKRAPMYCTGVGKAILAFLPWSYVEQFVLSKPMTAFTNNTITTAERLKEELAQVRERGYAMDDEEIELGLHCFAAPVFDHRKYPVGAISASFTYGRLWDMDLTSVTYDVKYYARQISERLGQQ